MSDNPKMKLSEQASRILRDISYARMSVLKAGDISSVDTISRKYQLYR